MILNETTSFFFKQNSLDKATMLRGKTRLVIEIKARKENACAQTKREKSWQKKEWN